MKDDVSKNIHDLEIEVNRRFDEMNQRFDQVNRELGPLRCARALTRAATACWANGSSTGLHF